MIRNTVYGATSGRSSALLNQTVSQHLRVHILWGVNHGIPPRSVLLPHHLEGNNNLFWGLRLRLYKLHHAIIHEFFNHSGTASVSRLRQCGRAAPCRSPKMQVVVSTDGMHWVRVHSRSCSRTYTQQLPTRCNILLL